ncbi:MAG: anaerobic ribonucleoside-triphosphate reductase [Oscillospiraceae bacterium]
MTKEFENATIRPTFAGNCYTEGVKLAKQHILDEMPEEFRQAHERGDIHIHDLEGFGKVNNCCTPDLLRWLRKRPLKASSVHMKFTKVLERIKQLIFLLANFQTGGIGLGNFDGDLAAALEENGIPCTEENAEILTECIADFIEWINETRTRYCRETYYFTLSVGMSTSEWGRAVTKALITAFGEQPMSNTKPNIVFKVSAAVNAIPGSPNYDLYRLALECTAKRMIPTYLLMDSAPNKDCDPNKLNIMGCRTRVYNNRNGECGSVGRGNIAYVSVNLPRIALESGSRGEFFETLRQRVRLAENIMLYRNELMRKNHELDSVLKEKIWDNAATIEDIIAQGTYSVGFIGLSETVRVLTGSRPFESEESRKLAEEIVCFIRELTDRAAKEYGLNFSVLATPGEQLTGRLCELDKERFHSVIQEKGFYTNSFHVDVDAGVRIWDKIRIEAPFHSLCGGGAITYIEFKSALVGNIDALESILAFATKQGISYIGFNFPLDVCNKCGFSGTYDNCPCCGSGDIRRIRRVSGYLEDKDYFTSGKKAELGYRRANR